MTVAAQAWVPFVYLAVMVVLCVVAAWAIRYGRHR